MVVHDTRLEAVAALTTSDAMEPMDPEKLAEAAALRCTQAQLHCRRILLSASFILFCTGAALLSYLLLREAGDAPKMAALTFVAGLLTVAAVEDMLEEAHEARAGETAGENAGGAAAEGHGGDGARAGGGVLN